MAKIPTMDEMAKQLAENALDNVLCDGKSLREWVRIIVSKDAISKAEVIKLIDKHTNDDGTLDDDITCILEKLPPIQPKAKVGKWTNKDASGYRFYGECSECGQEFCVDAWYTQNMKYCSNCGAKMEVE